jgi:hypothetical protein
MTSAPTTDAQEASATAVTTITTQEAAPINNTVEQEIVAKSGDVVTPVEGASATPDDLDNTFRSVPQTSTMAEVANTPEVSTETQETQPELVSKESL